MIKRLTTLYPKAIISNEPTLDSRYYWFHDSHSDQYIGILTADLTQKELNLLKTLFTMADMDDTLLLTEPARIWRNFILHGEAPPAFQKEECRLIHYSISHIREEFSYEEWVEAIKSLFPHDILIVPFHAHEGIIIEEKMEISMAEDELLSAIQAFESDFFFKVHFFIGRFHQADDKMRHIYSLENSIFHLSIAEQPEERIFTLEKLLPLYVYRSIPEEIGIFYLVIYNLFCRKIVNIRKLLKGILKINRMQL